MMLLEYHNIYFKVGSAEMIARIVDDLKDENELYRKMVMETIENIVSLMGANEIDARLEEQLIDGIVYAFQEQTQEVYSALIFSAEIYTKYCCFISHFLGCSNVGWIRYSLQGFGSAYKTIPSSDLWYYTVAS